MSDYEEIAATLRQRQVALWNEADKQVAAIGSHVQLTPEGAAEERRKILDWYQGNIEKLDAKADADLARVEEEIATLSKDTRPAEVRTSDAAEAGQARAEVADLVEAGASPSALVEHLRGAIHRQAGYAEATASAVGVALARMDHTGSKWKIGHGLMGARQEASDLGQAIKLKHTPKAHLTARAWQRVLEQQRHHVMLARHGRRDEKNLGRRVQGPPGLSEGGATAVYEGWQRKLAEGPKV